jgi:hypothetical protein
MWEGEFYYPATEEVDDGTPPSRIASSCGKDCRCMIRNLRQDGFGVVVRAVLGGHEFNRERLVEDRVVWAADWRDGRTNRDDLRAQ